MRRQRERPPTLQLLLDTATIGLLLLFCIIFGHAVVWVVWHILEGVTSWK